MQSAIIRLKNIMPVLAYIFFFHSLGVLTLHNDGVPAIFTEKYAIDFMSHRSVVAVERGEPHELEKTCVPPRQ